MSDKIGKARLIEKITDNAIMESFLHCRGNGERYRPLSGDALPGRRIMKLTNKEREVLKQCTARDFSWRGFK